MKTRFLSYLDLMCCGFGGALLMFLIVASAQPRRAPSNPMLVVRFRAQGEDGRRWELPGGELGIEYRRVGSRAWIRANGPSVADDLAEYGPRDATAGDGEESRKWPVQPQSAPGQGAEAVLICRRPRSGNWEFRAYLADYPAEDDLAPANDSPIPIVVEVLGAPQPSSGPGRVLTPGAVTDPPVLIEIGGRR